MQALGTDPLSRIVHRRDGEEWKKSDPGLHSRETGLDQLPAGRTNRLVGSFPGLFPKPPRHFVAG